MSEEIQDATQKCNEKLKAFEGKYRTWLRERRKAIRDLEGIVVDMDGAEFRNNVAQIVGSSVGLASGTIMIGSLLAAPFTGGVSLAIGAGVAGVIGVAGTITNITADELNENYALRRLKEANGIIENDRKLSEDLEMAENVFLQTIAVAKKIAQATKRDIVKAIAKYKQGREAAKIIANAVKLVGNGGRGFRAVGMTAAKVLGKAGVFAIVGAGFDIWSIVTSSQDIANGSKSTVGTGITRHVQEMRNSTETVQNIYAEAYELFA